MNRRRFLSFALAPLALMVPAAAFSEAKLVRDMARLQLEMDETHRAIYARWLNVQRSLIRVNEMMRDLGVRTVVIDNTSGGIHGGGGSGDGMTTIINLRGETFSRKQAKAVLEKITVA